MKFRNSLQLFLAVLLSTQFMLSCKDSNMKLGYSGTDLSKDGSIDRNKETKAASLKILNQGDWKLYSGATVNTIDLTQPILTGNDEGEFAIDVPTNTRSYFQLVTPTGSALLSDRHLPMTGGYNFRDLGGFKTKDGKYTKWGKIFRSDDLHKLTDADLEYLTSIPLVSIVDFRSEKEIKEAPDKNPASLKNNYKLSISPGDVLDLESITGKTEEEMEQIMIALNEELVGNDACIASYTEFFALLQSDKEVPLMFHCTAGKDRTGMGGALVLYALGVDDATIIKDYMASNDYLGDKYAQFKEENPAMKALLEVRPQYLQAGLDKIKAEHGSIDTFLEKTLKVDINKMREKYLY